MSNPNVATGSVWRLHHGDREQIGDCYFRIRRALTMTFPDGTRLTRTGGGPGTLTYMAPEQLDDGAVGPAADIWAWACCVVCAAHGASPFAATSTGAVIRRIVDTGPEPLALGAVQALDPALAAVVGRALTADPAARPADGAALVELLTASQGHPTPYDETVREQITRGWRTLAL